MNGKAAAPEPAAMECGAAASEATAVETAAAEAAASTMETAASATTEAATSAATEAAASAAAMTDFGRNTIGCKFYGRNRTGTRKRERLGALA